MNEAARVLAVVGANPNSTDHQLFDIISKQDPTAHRDRVMPALNWLVKSGRHVIPEYLGGGNDPDNIVISCRLCNRRKGWRH